MNKILRNALLNHNAIIQCTCISFKICMYQRVDTSKYETNHGGQLSNRIITVVYIPEVLYLHESVYLLEIINILVRLYTYLRLKLLT